MPVPSTFIKNVAIELHPNFQMDNSPLNMTISNDSVESIREDTKAFIGRRNHLKKFLRFLHNKTQKGIFLVTGYRGMGKTSFVNHVVRTYRMEKQKSSAFTVRTIHLTVAQNNPTEMDTLRQIAISVHNDYAEIHTKKERGWHFIEKVNNALKPIIILAFTATLIMLAATLFPDAARKIFESDWSKSRYDGDWAANLIRRLGYYSLSILLFAFILHIIFNQFKKWRARKEFDRPAQKTIAELFERTFAEITEEKGYNRSLNLEFSGITANAGETGPKKGMKYPLANPKEIEYFLKKFFFEAYNEEIEYIIIFDELDKIELHHSQGDFYREMDVYEKEKDSYNLQTLLRRRKQAVINIIAGLKNFFTTANARFIFIAGREMFDASLADVADKQSPLSSIFTYTFNIESLLKEDAHDENVKNTSSLTTAIEEFIKYQLTDPSLTDQASGTQMLNYVKKRCDISGLNENEKSKVYFMLQAFVTYLAYRSSGAPKKVIRAFHEFVVVGDDLFEQFEKNGSNSAATTIVVKLADQKKPESNRSQERCYLYFNHLNQYRIGFINYLYRPFLIEHGRNFKLFSENAIISVPYLFDHLIKFHPFAFSRPNLELVPELLSTNKTPTIKQDLDHIISYLSGIHMRDTDIELFEYKFYSKSLNEITFLSRVFEEEAAAFNFTLDESLAVKMLLNDKIKELRSIFSKFNNHGKVEDAQIYSISFYNANLGDLHFFDQEYDDAIANYSDAIRPINSLDMRSITLRDFNTLIRNKLKIGLCMEKIGSYEEALTIYTDATQDTKRFFYHHLNNVMELELSPGYFNTRIGKAGITFESSSLNDILQIVVQTFLAKIYIQEKMGLEGITSRKVMTTLGNFLKIADGVAEICGHNHLIVANIFLHIGKLIYYKNSSVPTENEVINDYRNLPGWMQDRITIIRNGLSAPANPVPHIRSRQPLLAYSYFVLGLDEVMRSRKGMMSREEKLNENELLHVENGRVCLNILPEYFDRLGNFITGKHMHKEENYTAYHYKYIAGFLSAIGDCILGMYGLQAFKIEETGPAKYNINNTNYHKLAYSAVFQKNAASEDNCEFLEKLHPSHHDHFSLADVLRCYYLSAQFYKKYARLASASFQYRKILNVLRIIITRSGNSQDDAVFFKFLTRTVISRASKMLENSGSHTNIHMTKKVGKTLTGLNSNAIKYNIANHPDSREIFFLAASIQLKLSISQGLETNVSWINSCHSIGTQYSRLMELDFYSKYLYNQFRDNLNSGFSIKLSKQVLIDYMFTLYSILRILKIYSTDYMLGHSFAACTHRWIAVVSEKIQQNSAETAASISEELKKLLGKGSLILLDASYHYTRAIDYYENAIQLQTAGMEYRRTIKDMIYLEDDFNDNAYHFGAALDRYLLTNDVFYKRIKQCEEALKKLIHLQQDGPA